MSGGLRVALLVDAYAPARSSAAVQLRDLARELARQGHVPTVIAPSPGLATPWSIEHDSGVTVLRVRTPRTKDIGRVRRALAEALLAPTLWLGLRRSGLGRDGWDGVVWYSPSIFLGPLAAWLRRRSRCRGYLILRDLFPDWAVDAGILRRGPAWRAFKWVERFQYRVADVIGVQTPANLPALRAHRVAARLDVLHNWLDAPATPPARALRAAGDPFLFAYTGNMGAAQGMDVLLDLAASLRDDVRFRFLFIGRGSEVARLRERATREDLSRVEFRDELDPDVLPTLLDSCHAGLIALDPRHTTHNIPGKFLLYLRCGLPVLASINPGNDLAPLINDTGVGHAIDDGALARLRAAALALADDPDACRAMGERGRALAERTFSPQAAATQVIAGLRG